MPLVRGDIVVACGDIHDETSDIKVALRGLRKRLTDDPRQSLVAILRQARTHDRGLLRLCKGSTDHQFCLEWKDRFGSALRDAGIDGDP